MNMDGKTVLVTGSTDGVGRYVATKLAAAGARVLIHGRDGGRGKALVTNVPGSYALVLDDAISPASANNGGPA